MEISLHNSYDIFILYICDQIADMNERIEENVKFMKNIILVKNVKDTEVQ